MNKTWLITGVSSGFGKLLAEKALIRGDRVVGTGRSTDALSDLRTRYPERLRIAALDLKDLGSVRGTVDGAFSAFGRIDVIVSNAGYGVLGAAEETTDAQLRDIVETNLLGSIALIRAVLLHLRHQGGGKILQVSSEGGDNSLIPVSACITRPNGASKGSWKPLLRKLQASTSGSR
jgi:NAD(P)-dependent dehydrogenase (short-subunit alcohol dehydrogenase family)